MGSARAPSSCCSSRPASPIAASCWSSACCAPSGCCEILPCATRKIIEIAHLAGFHDVSYFHRAFRRRFGQTPDDVRKLSGETG
ncbi:helix-turn-helix domain-containing protein [Bradyrhizobium centrosematis]|uniref:helix-turn-helix domain-containing protein n=1 Tax=Bradyrhizobium centrosematis TaxID=1300039 RepID=UPI00286DB72D|nr:helix-turn-helix domain-containing protein [Bradyrhizobium centrosematis]